MPSLTDRADRHVVVDRRDGHYLSFPDLCVAASGRLVVAYREADRHVARRSKLLCRTSDDQGRSWSPARVLNALRGHCPRMTRLSDGQLVLIDDASSALYWSLDEAETWSQAPFDRLQHGIPDRLIELDSERLLTTAHGHRGTHAQPAIGQPPSEQMVYLSEDRGAHWKPLSVLAADRNLVLCEASVARLPDGRLLALLRENSRVFEPLYACHSDDEGCTWSLPRPTPMIGHRPCAALTRGGRLLVTYRNLGPDAGTAAWLGDVDELDDFRVHGLSLGGAPRLEDDALVIEHAGAPRTGTYYALRPLTDPAHARATLEVEVGVEASGRNACGLYLGAGWRVLGDRVEADVEGAEPVALNPRRTHHLRLEYASGSCALFVDGQHRLAVSVPADNVRTRPVLFGNAVTRDGRIPGAGEAFADNAGRSVWHGLRLRVREPRYGRDYEWRWQPADGLPDATARARVLELRNDRFASAGDFGYSGWVEIDDGQFLCAYHHGAAAESGYVPGSSAHVVVTRFGEEDFGG